MMDDATSLEVAFTILAAWGVWRSARNLHDAERDRRAVVRLSSDVSLRIVARGYVRAERSRLVGQLMAFAAGMVALLASPGGVARVTVSACLIAFVVLLNIQSEISAMARRKVIETHTTGGTE